MAKVEVWLHAERVWMISVRQSETPPVNFYETSEDPGIEKLMEHGPKKVAVDAETLRSWYDTSADYWLIQDRLEELAEEVEEEDYDQVGVLPEGTD